MDIKLILEKYKKFLNGNSEVERADLTNAYLRDAYLTDKFYYIGNIGSRNSQTTVNLTKNIAWCGCFTGTMEEFEEKVKKTHINNNYYYDYMDFIELCKKKMDRIKNGGIK